MALGCLGASFYVNDELSLPALNNSIADDFNCYKSKRCFECVMRPQCGFCTTGIEGGTCMLANINNQSCTSLNKWSCNAQNYPTWLSVFLLVLYLALFSPGMGPMPWTINSEIYPLKQRALCIGIATSVNWVSNLVVSLTFLTLIDNFTAQGAFWLYAGISLIGFFWLFFKLPETKGLHLNEVVDLFR